MKTQNDLHGQTTAPRHGLQRAIGSFGAQSGTASIGGRLRALLRRGGQGQAIVELAFMMPIICLFLFGICWYGLVMMKYVQLQSAVNTGAGVLAINQDVGVTNPCGLATTAMQNVTGLNWSNITVTYEENGVAVGGTSGNACVGTLASSTPVTVTAVYPVPIPIVYAYVPSLNLYASLTVPAN
jgi:Flp pilus assembly protein TadG